MEFLGLDLSTQQLKAVILDENLVTLKNSSVHFDSELPEFRTHGGVHEHKDGCSVTAPTLMWVKALDLLLNKLKASGVDFSKVAAVSGCGQQHGSVWWRRGAAANLKNVTPSGFLHTELLGCFAVKDSPVWMDSSTSSQCSKLEQSVGGKHNLAELTGSRGYERFTGPQIAKMYETNQSVYQNTERISLVSSFLCSIFLGDYAPIDYADGAGMNLLDITKKDWDDDCLSACAPFLRERLGSPKDSSTILGPIANYFVERYSFDENCKVVNFTGDNPASLMGMRLKDQDVAVSLGTSDTVFMHMPQKPVILDDGHVFYSPIDSNWYMAMLCFKNGSLTRERIRDNCSEGSWDLFNELLNSTPRGNFGNMGLFFDKREIRPFVQGDFLFNKAGDQIKKFTSKEVQVRAVIEGQFIALRAQAEDAGLEIDGPRNSGSGKPIGGDTETKGRIIATGGASKNNAILQVLSDVWGLPVYVHDSADSAVLGAAYQAKHAISLPDQTFYDVTQLCQTQVLVAQPHSDCHKIYDPMVERYRSIVEKIEKNARSNV